MYNLYLLSSSQPQIKHLVKNLARYLAAILDKEEKMWMLFLNFFFGSCPARMLNASLQECVSELESSNSSISCG